MKVAIIGAGNMGGAIARALAATGEYKIALSNPTLPKLEAFKTEFPDEYITVTTDNVEAVIDADVVILAVKPWLLGDVLEQVKPRLVYRRNIIVSLAGGVSLDTLDDMLVRGDELPAVCRVIPDTALSIGKSMTFISGRRAAGEAIATVESLFRRMGEVAVIEERLMDAATALSSCGIAYVYKFIQACVQAGVEMGFRPADALRYVCATVDGAAAMLSLPGASPQPEIDKVTTPGGMTIKGINALEHNGFTSAVINAILTPVKK
ncbi:MAG: pyrroline-5-carboxylate reductase [Muribaculaceae bacterium]|nr:pyrroline-5-carboxylate reductase [Muribaculaceae bacterium]